MTPGLLPTIGRYRLLKRLALGGMAEIYLAQAAGPEGFSKPVVIKRILPDKAQDPAHLALFVDEAKLVARLNHANVVQIFDFGELPDDQGYYMAMEYVHGRDLREVMDRCRDLGHHMGDPRAVQIVAEVLEGLTYAHEFTRHGRSMEIVHRDISPRNILLGFNGDVKLTDFGIARARSTRFEERGVIRGKLLYMSPEQIRGKELDQRSDLYSVGLVLYELLTGVKALADEDGEGSIPATLAADFPPARELRPDLSPTLARCLDLALARQREDRYQSGREFLHDLRYYLLNEVTDPESVDIGPFLERLFPEVKDLTVTVSSASALFALKETVIGPARMKTNPQRPSAKAGAGGPGSGARPRISMDQRPDHAPRGGAGSEPGTDPYSLPTMLGARSGEPLPTVPTTAVGPDGEPLPTVPTTAVGPDGRPVDVPNPGGRGEVMDPHTLPTLLEERLEVDRDTTERDLPPGSPTRVDRAALQADQGTTERDLPPSGPGMAPQVERGMGASRWLWVAGALGLFLVVAGITGWLVASTSKRPPKPNPTAAARRDGVSDARAAQRGGAARPRVSKPTPHGRDHLGARPEPPHEPAARGHEAPSPSAAARGSSVASPGPRAGARQRGTRKGGGHIKRTRAPHGSVATTDRHEDQEPVRLTINALPYALVWIDGKGPYETPVSKRLPPGGHTLKLVNESRGTTTTDHITLQPGIPMARTYDMRR